MKLSVIIPARNELYLAQTINSLFESAEGEIEVIAILDGYWPQPPIDNRPNLTLVHHTESIGMRSAINEAANLANGEYLMKCDAHCLFDKGFDTKMRAVCWPNHTVVPRRYALDAEKWERGKQKCDYQYIRREDFKGRDWKEYEGEDLMTFQGSCWFMHRQRFFDLECLDDVNYGHMGKEAQEICLKSWLSGGRCVVNKNTWYAHLDKKERGYPLSKETKDKSRLFAMDFWMNNRWPKQTRNFLWLIEEFNPPTWAGYVESDKILIKPTPSPGCEDYPTEKDLEELHSIDDEYIERKEQMEIPEAVIPVKINIEMPDAVTLKTSPVIPATINYEGMRKSKLRDLLKKRGVSTYGIKSMADMIKVLKAPETAIHDLRRYFISKNMIHRIQLSPITVRGFQRTTHLFKLFHDLGLKVGVEVGTKAGRNAEHICLSMPGVDLTVVDPWMGYGDDRRYQDPEKHEGFYQDACKRLEPYKVKVVRAKSMDAVGDFALESLDFVYIDGNHCFDYVMEDLIAWNRRVKPGGIVSGHDYYKFKKGGVVDAVNSYVKSNKISALFLCDEKTPSFFWRKP